MNLADKARGLLKEAEYDAGHALAGIKPHEYHLGVANNLKKGYDKASERYEKYSNKKPSFFMNAKKIAHEKKRAKSDMMHHALLHEHRMSLYHAHKPNQ